VSLTVPDIPTDLTVKVLREQLGVYDAREEELRHFARVCTALELSPFAGQIVLIGRHDRRAARVVYRPQITVDGRRARAERTGLLDGIDGPEWCGPRRFDETGDRLPRPKLPLEWEDVWTDDEAFPYCARVLVLRKDWSRPANGTAKWSEFAQYVPAPNGGQKLSPFWYRMPSHMLGKVAESLALRRAFPNDISYRLATGEPGDDTGSVLAEAEASAQPRPQEVAGEPGADAERVPAWVHDNAPEAGQSEAGTERYDPADGDPTRPFA
jgi:hypothetical protein